MAPTSTRLLWSLIFLPPTAAAAALEEKEEAVAKCFRNTTVLQRMPMTRKLSTENEGEDGQTDRKT